MLDLLLVSITHLRRCSRWAPVGAAVILQSSPGEIGPGKEQFDDIGSCTAPLASIMVTDLTVTGLVPMFATLHSPPTPTDPNPLERIAALAVPPRIIPARAVHTHT